jgi:3',5'-cyclic AMP phosphodiesterase CpdA
MTYRIAQISDTHLSRARPFFVANFEKVAAAIAASAPDLVLNTGDMALDGVAEVSDLAEARRLHAGVGLPTRFIPGNHDLGDGGDMPGSAETGILEASRERYISHFGEDYWSMDVPGWRFIAINAQLLASDLAAAGPQLDFVAAAAEAADGRRLALFVHKPLFDVSPAETAVTGRFLNPAPRSRLLQAFGAQRPAVVASGHVHQYRSTEHEGTRHVWAPSTGFVIPDARQPCYGEKEVGYVEHRFAPDGTHMSRFVRVDNLHRLVITDFPDAYPGRI